MQKFVLIPVIVTVIFVGITAGLSAFPPDTPLVGEKKDLIKQDFDNKNLTYNDIICEAEIFDAMRYESLEHFIEINGCYPPDWMLEYFETDLEIIEENYEDDYEENYEEFQGSTIPLCDSVVYEAMKYESLDHFLSIHHCYPQDWFIKLIEEDLEIIEEAIENSTVNMVEEGLELPFVSGSGP